MRTTVTIDDLLLKQTKEQAARHGKSLSAFVEDALREVLARSRQPREPIDLPVFRGGGGVRPGVPSMDRTSEVMDLLDEADGVFDQYRTASDATR